MTLLRVEGASLVRGGRLLFEGMSLAIAAGEAVHVVGDNGSGKSSLIRMVAGLLKPQGGRMERCRVALADAGLALDGELPLGRALAFWNGPQSSEAIEAFGLSHLAQVPVRLLSTGQAQRARLARVMASGAPLWLLDEPQNGLDRDGIERLDAAMDQHRAGGGGVLAASHVAMGGQWREIAL